MRLPFGLHARAESRSGTPLPSSLRPAERWREGEGETASSWCNTLPLTLCVKLEITGPHSHASSAICVKCAVGHKGGIGTRWVSHGHVTGGDMWEGMVPDYHILAITAPPDMHGSL